MDEDDLFIEPTLVVVSDIQDSLLVDESFGPLIPILPVADLSSAIRIANTVSGTPLGIYPFGTKAETSRILNETRSGGASINDSFFHAAISTLAFGGVGESGQGSYRGKASFDAFTHRRSVTSTPAWFESFLFMRYPPYNNSKLAMFQMMMERTVAFDREGNEVPSLLRRIVTLGGKSDGGALSRWIVVAFGEYQPPACGQRLDLPNACGRCDVLTSSVSQWHSSCAGTPP